MKVRFYHAMICTMEQDYSFMRGEVWVEEDKIIFVGSEAAAAQKQRKEKIENQTYVRNSGQELSSKISRTDWDEEIDCEYNLLLPGFKNAHTHSPMTFLRSYADDLRLDEWLQQRVFPMEARLTADDMYHLTKLAIMEYLTSGITSVFDMYLLTEPRVQAALECGYRMVICGSVNDFTGSVAQLEQEYKHYHGKNGLISYQLGFHAEYTTNREKIEQIADVAARWKAPVYMHLSETKSEVEQCIERYKKTPVSFLYDCGIFRYGGGGFHCVHMTEEDMHIMADNHLYVITNPASNMKLASGIAPISKMEQMGIPIAIGTDGAASNNCLDMFREMFLLTGLQKLLEQDAAAMDANKVLHMATVSGAHAMGLPDCDCIAAGKQADLVLIDLQRPNMQPENCLTKNLVYSGSKDNVKLTMVAGKILYREHQFYIGCDASAVYEKANEIIGRMNRA